MLKLQCYSQVKVQTILNFDLSDCWPFEGHPMTTDQFITMSWMASYMTRSYCCIMHTFIYCNIYKNQEFDFIYRNFILIVLSSASA